MSKSFMGRTAWRHANAISPFNAGVELDRDCPGRAADPTVQLLDLLSVAIMLVDAEGGVLFANRYAEELLGAGDGLFLEQGCLAAVQADETVRLRDLIAGAATRRGAATRPQTGALQISRPQHGSPLSLVAIPLAGANRDAAQAKVALFCHDPTRACTPPIALLEQLYGLTPCEARLARHLLCGEDLRQAAQELSVSLNTARSHLKHVFQKTGATRQADLLHLLIMSVALPRFDQASEADRELANGERML
jgi:DNA-binding CsgD family transcriptional regulator